MLLVAVLAFAVVLARIRVLSARLILALRSLESGLAFASLFRMLYRTINAFAQILAIVRAANFKFTSFAGKSMTTSAVGFWRARHTRSAVQTLVTRMAHLCLAVGASEASVADAVGTRMMLRAWVTFAVVRTVGFARTILHFIIFTCRSRKSIFAFACGIIIVLVAVLASSSVLALDVIAITRLILTVLALVAFRTVASGQRLFESARGTCATVTTIRKARTLLMIAMFANEMIYAYA